jgi:hypothetical protein
VARPRKKTQWYENGEGQQFHVEVGSKAEDRLIRDGYEAIPDPTAKPEPDKKEKPKDKKPEPDKKPDEGKKEEK